MARPFGDPSSPVKTIREGIDVETVSSTPLPGARDRLSSGTPLGEGLICLLFSAAILGIILCVGIAVVPPLFHLGWGLLTTACAPYKETIKQVFVLAVVALIALYNYLND